MSLAENLRSFRPENGFQFADLYTVVSLGDDPRTVVISDGNLGAERAVPCAASYRGRAVGDVVLAVQLSGGPWLVLCKIGPADAS